MRVLVLSEAPSQWQSPLFRFLARQDRIDLEVAFASTMVPIDRELGHQPVWGEIGLNQGYRWTVAPTSLLSLTRWSVSITRRRDLDFVLLPGWGTRFARTALFASLICRRARRRTWIFTDATDLTRRTGFRSSVRRILLRSISWAGLRFVVPGAAARSHLLANGITASRIAVMPYAVDNDWIAKEVQYWRHDRDNLRSEIAHSSEPEAIILLAIVKLIQREGADRLVQSFLINAAKYPAARLVLVGDGPDRASIAELCEQPGGEGIILAGYQPYSNLPRFYAIADWFVHLPDLEPWGLSVNEAAAAALPLLCSSRAGASEDLLEDGHNGILLRDSDSEVECLQRALAIPRERLASMGAASYQLSERVHYQRWVDQLLSLKPISRSRGGA